MSKTRKLDRELLDRELYAGSTWGLVFAGFLMGLIVRSEILREEREGVGYNAAKNHRHGLPVNQMQSGNDDAAQEGARSV